jgi:L-ascorbate metabolism protein UlaG (beta-lactamase superfamily)
MMQNIRNAMLRAEAEWLGRADKAKSTTERIVAQLIAEAFHNEATTYNIADIVITTHGVDDHYDSIMNILGNYTRTNK